jgi:hypothetical protein
LTGLDQSKPLALNSLDIFDKALNGIFMNQRKKLGAAFISLAVSGFAGLMIVAPGALAVGVDVGGLVGTVLTEPKCDWQIVSIPASFAIGSAAATKYEGAALDLSIAGEDMNVYVSGAQAEKTAAGNTPCIFYNTGTSPKTRPEVVMSINTTTFEAQYQVNGEGAVLLDPTMDIDLSENPLKITMGSCLVSNSAWNVSSLELGPESLSGVALAIPGQTSVLPAQLSDAGLRCDTSYGVRVTIPEHIEPVGAGEQYTFRGVTLTTVLTAQSD